MKKNLLLLGLTVLSFQAYAQTSSVQVANKAIASAEMQAEIQQALILQESSHLQSTQRVMEGATYVGSFRTSDGPLWTTNPEVLSGVEAAALLFGGSPSDYAISTNPNTTDPLTITHTAWVSKWGAGCEELADDFSLDLGDPGYNDLQIPNAAMSAYVTDWCLDGQTNYVWRVNETIEPEECVAPTEVTIERLSPTSIAISTNVEVWSMYVDIFNNPPSFNSRTKSHWTKLRNTYINNNVVPNRTYYLWFRANCPNNEVSEYTELYTVEPWSVARSSSNPNATINQVHEQLVNVDVFPNPTSDELNISGINAQQIRIFDSNGTAIFNGRVINNQLNLRQLQTGVYRMVITDENNQEHAVQVIKR